MRLNVDADAVDLFVLNTCGFLRSAVEEAEEFIEQALEQKRAGAIRFLVVAGCAVAAESEALAKKYPEADAWIGPFDERRLGEIVAELFAGAATSESASDVSTTPQSPVARALDVLSPAQVAAARASNVYHHAERNLSLDDSTRERLTLPHVAYLKIADGCDRFCSYCAIPHIRGRFVSKPYETILDEASRLADQGVRELTLIAQETTFWGADLYGAPDLKRLLEALKSRNQFDWIRVLYAYPLFWDKDLAALFKLEERGSTSIVPYVDMPLQHCNTELLAKMNRKVDKARIEDLLDMLRAEIPSVVLRTSFIVGFPGETDAMFRELIEFVDKRRFERAGVFEFSPEPETPAAAMPDQVDEKTKARRFERLYAKQERISHQFARSWIGKTLDVLIDERAVAENGAVMKNACLGRTYADAPDVDPIVYVTGRNLTPGEILPCEVVDAQGLDLIAVPVDPEKLFVTKEERREAYEREEARRSRESSESRDKSAKKAKKSGNEDARGGKSRRARKDR